MKGRAKKKTLIVLPSHKELVEFIEYGCSSFCLDDDEDISATATALHIFLKARKET